MSDINMVVISGRVVADPELKFTAKGTPVLSLRLASSHRYRDKSQPDGEFKEDRLFIDAEMFGKMAETVAQYKKKGDPVMVRGRLNLNEWAAQDGTKRKTYRIFTESINFLGAKRQGEDSAEHEEDSGEAAASLSSAPAGVHTATVYAAATARPAHSRSAGTTAPKVAIATGTRGALTGASHLPRATASGPVEDLPF